MVKAKSISASLASNTVRASICSGRTDRGRTFDHSSFAQAFRTSNACVSSPDEELCPKACTGPSKAEKLNVSGAAQRGLTEAASISTVRPDLLKTRFNVGDLKEFI